MKCKNCNYSPVFLGNKCPNCGEKITQKRQKKPAPQKSTVVKKKLNTISAIDMKNIEQLTKALKLTKGNFQSYIKLTTFIEELACKIHFDSVDDIEDLIITLEHDSVKRISDFFTKVILKIDKSDKDFESLILEKKETLDNIIEKYENVKDQNEQLLNIENNIKNENEKLEKLKSNLGALEKMEKNIERSDINQLALNIAQITERNAGNISEQVTILKSKAVDSLKILETHNKANSETIEALKESIENTEENKVLDESLVDIATEITLEIVAIHKKLDDFDMLLKKNI